MLERSSERRRRTATVSRAAEKYTKKSRNPISKGMINDRLSKIFA